MKDLIRHILREHTSEIKEQSKFKNYDINDESFANLFNYFLTELKNNVGYSHSKMKKGFMLTVRAWSGKPPKIISKKVLDHFIENHPNVNPFKANHRPRNKYGIDVIFEHTTPVNNFMKQLIASKNLDEVKAFAPFDAVVTMGCGDACPWMPAKQFMDWQIPDPKHMEPKEFNEVRDFIKTKVEELLNALK